MIYNFQGGANDGANPQGGVIFVNGHEVGRSTDWQEPFQADVSHYLQPGRNTIAVAVFNQDGEGGLTKSVRLSAEPSQQLPLQWEMAPQLDGVAAKWFEPQTDLTGWTSADLVTNTTLATKVGTMPAGPANDLATWYRMEFTLPDAAAGTWVPWGVVLEASGNGWIYLNNQPLGRYWEAGPQRKFYLPECWLNTGSGAKNVLTLCLRPTDKGAKLNAAEVAPYAEFAEQR